MRNLKYDSDKVDDYSKKELAEMIFSGKVSREQVNIDGLFRKHRPMLDKELDLMKQEELDWANATALNTVDSYQVYLDEYNPTIVEGESITDGWDENTVYIGRHVEDARRLQAAVKKNNDDEKETEKDKAAWIKAKKADIIESYREYISTFDRQPPMYRGQYVDEAKLKINQLQDKSDWNEAVSFDTVESYKTYLSKYDTPTSTYRGAFISEAKQAIDRLTPRPESPKPPVDPLKNEAEDWAKATRIDCIEAYKSYIAQYETLGGKFVVDAKNAIERLLEEKTWSEALKKNNIIGYKKYISIYQNKNGKHLVEAKRKLNQLEEEEDELAWMLATQKDDLSAYRDYLSRYDVLAPKYRGHHIEGAKKRIDELSPTPAPNPRYHWWKWMGLFVFLVIGWLTYVQWHDNAWPFNIQDGGHDDVHDVIVQEVDSLQWAIDNHDIPLLTRYAELDSTRAYYPLSTELWSQSKDTLNSLKYIRRAINSVDSKDPLYDDYENHLDLLKNILDYNGTIGHVMQPLPANIEERLPILVSERRISERAIFISKKYNFPYVENPTLVKYINEDFNRWVNFARKTTNIPSKIDAYNAALQLKDDSQIREKLKIEKIKYKQQNN